MHSTTPIKETKQATGIRARRSCTLAPKQSKLRVTPYTSSHSIYSANTIRDKLIPTRSQGVPNFDTFLELLEGDLG